MFSPEIMKLAAECEARLAPMFRAVDETAYYNTGKVLDVFREHRLSERHFNPSCGYGYNDDGRDLCDTLYAAAFGCEAGFARAQLISGTHALAVALYGVLRPGDTLFSVTGKPYDTLDSVIGFSGESVGDGSLADLGVKYRDIPLCGGKTLDLSAAERVLSEDKSIKAVFVQRSKGYGDRRTLTVAEIDELAALVHRFAGVYLIVDNCYGEFTETVEPCSLGADIIVGSLIKNAGGGMADIGGYIAGTHDAVELCGYRLSCPGVGLEAGASLGQTRNILKGFFYAPHTVAEALKTAHLAAYLFSEAGFSVNPAPFETRYDIIQAITLGSGDALVGFCRGIQSASPVDSHVSPEPWAMPGYDSDVIMAAGAFVQGSSIELSADGPIKPPYAVYFQGGLTWEHAKLGVLMSLQKLVDANIVTLP